MYIRGSITPEERFSTRETTATVVNVWLMAQFSALKNNASQVIQTYKIIHSFFLTRSALNYRAQRNLNK